MQKQLDQAERELRIRNHSSKTIKVIFTVLESILSLRKTALTNWTWKASKAFCSFLKKGVSAQTRNPLLNAVKFYYRSVIKTNGKIEVRSAKKNRSLPIVL